MTLPNRQQFEQHAKDEFHIFFSDQSLPCHIEEVKAGLMPKDNNHKEQFSVVFACDENDVAEQGVYKVSHQKLGEFELFLVPVFGDEKGVHYEAVFT